MKTLHTYGCSLTYGCEISGPGIDILDEKDQKSSWGWVLSDMLGYDRTVVHARSGASNRDIAHTALQHMLDNPTHDHWIGWTYTSRLNYWYPVKDNKHNLHNFIVSDSLPKGCPEGKLFENLKKYVDHWEHSVNFLQQFFMVQQTALAHNISVNHVMIGANNFYTQQHQDWHVKQTVPHIGWGGNYHGSVGNNKLVDHPLWKTWTETPVMFRDEGLYIRLLDFWLRNNLKQQRLNGVHWNARGHVDAAKAISWSLQNEQ